MRIANSTDFYIDVPPVGRFRFGRRTYGDRIKIRAEFLRVVKDLDTGEVDKDGRMLLDEELSGHASIVAAYKVLCVECPPGWADLEALDLTAQPDVEDRIWDVYLGLRSKEDSFRVAKNPDQNGEAAGAGDQQVNGVLVPPEVQPVATGPALPGTDA